MALNGLFCADVLLRNYSLTLTLVFKVIQYHCFQCQSKHVYDFLLVLPHTVPDILRLIG